LTALAGVAASSLLRPGAARAEEPGKPPTIGVLGTNAAIWAPWTAAFAERLRQLGWIEGRTIAIEYRWSEGRLDRIAEIAAEFVRRKLDIIVTEGTGAPIVKQATSSTPIVLAISVDPVGSGLVASLAHPGGNVTGVSNQGSDLASKRLELLREIVPRLHRVAVMAHAEQAQAVIELAKVQAAARSFGIEVVPLEIHRPDDIAPAVVGLTPKADALYIASDALLIANLPGIIALALEAGLPTIFNNSDYVRAGALIAYGPNYSDQFRRTAEIVDKILRGTRPGDIPVEQPTKFELAVNLKTAKALGLTIPESFLSLADEVIE